MSDQNSSEAIGSAIVASVALLIFYSIISPPPVTVTSKENMGTTHPDIEVLFDTAVPFWNDIQNRVNELGTNGGGAIIGTSDAKIGYIWCSDEHSCLHETGHAMHRFLRVSELSFEKDIDEYIEISRAAGCTGRREQERNFECLAHNFPGLNGNDANTDENGENPWGGYGEFYADVYAEWKQGYINLPEPLAFYWTGAPE